MAPEQLRDLVQAALARDPTLRPTAARLAATVGAALVPTLPLPATAPHVVLAAVGGPDDSRPHTSKQCPSDHEEEEEEEADDQEDQGEGRPGTRVEVAPRPPHRSRPGRSPAS